MVKRERGSKIIFPLMLRLLGRISCEEERRKQIKIFKKIRWRRMSSCMELCTTLPG